MLDKIYEANK